PGATRDAKRSRSSPLTPSRHNTLGRLAIGERWNVVGLCLRSGVCHRHARSRQKGDRTEGNEVNEGLMVPVSFLLPKFLSKEAPEDWRSPGRFARLDRICNRFASWTAAALR